jgi:hypothetical protein
MVGIVAHRIQHFAPTSASTKTGRPDDSELLHRGLVLTASAASVIKSVKGEVAGVLTKPFASPDLIDAVRKIEKK